MDLENKLILVMSSDKDFAPQLKRQLQMVDRDYHLFDGMFDSGIFYQEVDSIQELSYFVKSTYSKSVFGDMTVITTDDVYGVARKDSTVRQRTDSRRIARQKTEEEKKEEENIEYWRRYDPKLPDPYAALMVAFALRRIEEKQNRKGGPFESQRIIVAAHTYLKELRELSSITPLGLENEADCITPNLIARYDRSGMHNFRFLIRKLERVMYKGRPTRLVEY